MEKIDLNGKWKIKGASGQRGGKNISPFIPVNEKWMDGTVPGCIQLDFVNNGMYGDPTEAHNCLDMRWIEEQYWNYRKKFTLTKEQCNRNVRLVFEGLDLTAIIYVNGQVAGSHNNFYTPCKLDITQFVREGENEINVEIESGLFYAANKNVAGYYTSGETVDHKLHKRIWLRKPQSATEWDWSPRLLTVGIYKNCYLELSGGVFADETFLSSVLTDDYRFVDGKVKQYCTVVDEEKIITLTVKVKETGQTFHSTANCKVGKACLELDFHLEDPKLWNPRGYGEQNLYTMEITIQNDQNCLCHLTKKTGFRKVELIQKPHPVEGTYFILKINGHNIFAKGGNFVPIDILYCRSTRKEYEILLQRAVEANCNTMRVWGGGVYENDDFYELCDEYGILVWQDFVSACANYPATDHEWFENFKSEVVHQIRRLSVNPSLVVWCGNNELEEGMWVDKGEVRYPDASLYYWLIPKLLKEEGEKRYYQPSSPWSPDFEKPNCDSTGDQHPWSVGFSEKNYYKYRNMVCRFPNEGGFLGPNSLPTMKKCFGNNQNLIHSFDWQVHDNVLADISLDSSPDFSLKHWLDREIHTMSVQDYVYYGGLIHGEALTEYILNFRRRKFDSASAIFWMYNDCWPCTRSWTIVDYYKNRTPAFYPVKRAFAPLAVDIVKENGTIKFFAINDFLEDCTVEIEYGFFTIAGEYQTMNETVRINENSSLLFAEHSEKEGAIPYAILSKDKETLSRRRFLDVKLYELDWKTPDIRVTYENDRTTFVSDRFVMDVCIDLNGDEVGDNFFDLFPNKSYTVKGKATILYQYCGK